jgi:cephalosporin hydroxylase
VDPISKFRQEVQANVASLRGDTALRARSLAWLRDTLPHRYSYNFSWMGVPIIQYPQDMIAMQELIWRVRPQLIIETGIAHGGSLVYYASLLELLGAGEVLGIDIEIRPHNRAAIEAHPMARRISMIEGSAIDEAVVREVRAHAAGRAPVLVVLDSNHTHAHVLAELRAYADLVTVGSYCVVFDTVVEDLPADLYPDRPWSVGNNPKTAVHEFLRQDARFEIDLDLEAKLMITVAPDGYLKRLR